MVAVSYTHLDVYKRQIQCFTQKGDKVIIQPPVYHPFRIVPEKMKREVVYNPLKMVDGIYEMDFDHLESIIDDECKVCLLYTSSYY